MQVTLITVGTLKEDYLKEAVSEYQSRLTTYCSFKEINLKEEKISDEDNPAEVSEALAKEGEQMLSKIPKGSAVIALCVEGKELSSPEFASAVGKYGDASGKICFLIGSSHGIAPTVKAKADLKLSYSRMTLPHQLMRVFFMESLYRAFTILAGKKYHK